MEINGENSQVLNITGEGKGKTTAALGITLRALGWEWEVAFVQFIKNDKETGEQRFFARHFPDMLFKQVGLGCTFIYEGDHKEAARQGWQEAAELLRRFPGKLLVLDELNIAVHKGFIDVEEVIEAVQNRRSGLNVVITGRYAAAELLEICDSVSEIMPLKHPLERGIPAARGLDF